MVQDWTHPKTIDGLLIFSNVNGWPSQYRVSSGFICLDRCWFWVVLKIRDWWIYWWQGAVATHRLRQVQGTGCLRSKAFVQTHCVVCLQVVCLTLRSMVSRHFSCRFHRRLWSWCSLCFDVSNGLSHCAYIVDHVRPDYSCFSFFFGVLRMITLWVVHVHTCLHCSLPTFTGLSRQRRLRAKDRRLLSQYRCSLPIVFFFFNRLKLSYLRWS